MSPLRVRLAELSLVGGKRQERGYNARMVSPPPDAPEARKGTLVMLLDLGGPSRHRRRHLRQLLNTIQSTYYTTPGTITSALVHALRTAHQELLAINESMPEDEEGRFLCNAACLVLHDNEIYLAQMGATTVAVLLPTGLHWFSPLQDEEEDPIPMGLERDIRPHTARMGVYPGTMVLMLDSGWLGQMDAVLFRRAISRANPEEVLDELARAVQVSHVSALALKLEDTPTEEREPAPVYTIVEEPEEELTPEAKPEPTEQAEPLGRKLVEQVRHVAERLLPEDGEEEEIPPMPEPPPIERPRPWPFRRRETRRQARPWRRWVWLALVLLPILIILATTFLWWQRAQEQETQYRAFLTEAQAAIQRAATTDDKDLARQYLRQAEAALQQAAQIRPDAPILEQLRAQIRDRRLVVEQIKPLYVMWPLATVPGTDPVRILVQDNNIYLVDRADDTVYRYTLDETGEAIVEGSLQRVLTRGEVIDDQAVGDLIDIAWLPAGIVSRVSGVIALDGSGTLFKYDSIQGQARIVLARPDTWQSPQRMLVYAERLYVLDPRAGTIFRFPPTGEGYTAPAQSYFTTPVNLSGVQDFAIDGNVYLLYPDGRVLRYYTGAQTEFKPDISLNAPTAIYTTDRLKYIYIADAGNGRIVVLDKENGAFIAQLVPGDGFNVDFTQVRAIYVTDDERSLFILTGTEIWRAPLGLE